MMDEDRSNIENNITFFNTFNFRKDLKILEVGCGTGRFSRHLYQDGYWNISGVDISQSGIAIAKEKCPEVDYFVMHGENLDFAESSFDLVVSFDLVEHIPDVDRHFSEVHRVLKKGGQYIFATPNKWTNIPWEIMQTRSLSYKLEHPSLHNFFELGSRLKMHKFEYDIIKLPVVSAFRVNLVRKKLGVFAAFLFKHFPFDLMPIHLSTNFFVRAVK